MKAYESILLDLDGTVTDSGLGITRSVQFALRKMGVEPPKREALFRFIGPPLAQSFEEFCGFSPENAKIAVEYYREYYKERGMLENTLIEGFDELLADLAAAGRILVLATSKPEVFARAIVEHFGIARYFSAIVGSNLDGTRTRKGEVVACALAACPGSARERAVMIGDRAHDILGAKENGLDSIGVLFGYGSRAELEAAGADRIAQDVPELRRLLLG